MVFFFTSVEGYTIYMGKDKFENEDLIKYGVPEDMWFHVDDLSSAHVYLRLKPDQRLEDVSQETIDECAQLVKANSIEGCKKHEVYVIYTRWRNLHKTNDMQVGAIGYHDRSKVRRMKVEKNNSVVNRINKTKREEHPDLAALQQQRAYEIRMKMKGEKKAAFLAAQEEERQREEERKLRSYEGHFVEENMKSNAEHAATVDESAAKAFEEDFF